MSNESNTTNMQKVAKHETDTGSAEVQIANLTDRIKTLSKHLETNRKDKHSQRGLLQMVADRRKLVKYLKRRKPEIWEKVSSELSLKK